MPKTFKKRAHREEEDESSQEDVKRVKKTRAAPASADGGAGRDADGNPYWELSAKRRVNVNQYQKKTFVNIREYYEAEGEMKPGKKGISLSVEQYQALVKAIPAINAVLLEQGVAADDVGEDEAGKLSGLVKGKQKAAKPKANIEATSDEDSE